MRKSIKPAFFHSVLIALISVCNYFMKINDAVAVECTTAQLNECKAQCASPLVAMCSGGPITTCSCVCSSSDEYNETTPACYWAMTHTFSCTNGKKINCFSFDRSSRSICDYGSTLKCRRVYLFDESSTRAACSCRYFNTFSETSECYSHIYYGNSCQYTCPSGCGAVGKRSTLTPGGSITDCSVYVVASCDSTGCFDSHTVPYK